MDRMKQFHTNKNFYSQLKEKYGDFITTRSVDCNEGWHLLISDCIEKLYSKYKDCVRISCLKEKFGLLRIYADFNEGVSEENYQEIYKILMEAENNSENICEMCGSTHNVTTDANGFYWIKTLCDVCRKLEK